jgi:hypothetical protein
MSNRRRYVRHIFLATIAGTLALSVASERAEAQEGESGWTFDSELGASIFFGASKQNAVLAKGAVARDAGSWEVGFNYGFDYGEATDANDVSFVNKRSWNTEVTLDLYEESRISPFAFVNASGSFEKQVDSRVRGGAGARYRFVNTDISKLDFSLAALVDRTDPRATDGVEEDPTTVGRLSARVRASKDVSEGRVKLSLVSFYLPNFEDFEDYQVEAEASVTFQLNDDVGLKLSLVDKYDSLAEDRGAISNNDGRLFFSIITTLP